jgi:PPOX class probable F420-dependent enzyme
MVSFLQFDSFGTKLSNCKNDTFSCGARFVALESYRRDASAISTPMWYVERDGLILLRTNAATAKVRRIRANPRVRLAPSTVAGKIVGSWRPGRARLMSPAEADEFNPALRRKYGLFKCLIDLFNRLRGITIVGIEVTLDDEA